MTTKALFTLLALLLAACGLPPVAPTATPAPTAMSTATRAPTPPPTRTPPPTWTPTPPPTPSPTPWSTCTPLPEDILYVIDETVAGDLEPGIEQEVWEAIGVLQQALEQRAPAWAQYRVETVGNPVHPLRGSLAEYIWDQAHAPLTLVNPRVLLVTAGVALDWQLPQDRPLPDAISEIGGQLWEYDLAFRFDPQVRAQYPHVANAASYALYAFFEYDLEKLDVWQREYDTLFGHLQPRIRTMNCTFANDK